MNYAVPIAIVAAMTALSHLFTYSVFISPCEDAAEIKGLTYYDYTMSTGCIVSDDKGNLYKVWMHNFSLSHLGKTPKPIK